MVTLSKADMIREIRTDTGISRSDIEFVLDSLFSNIALSLNHGKRVQFSGFGTFELKHRNPRTGRNPHTGEAVPIPERVIPWFSPGNTLKHLAVSTDTKK